MTVQRTKLLLLGLALGGIGIGPGGCLPNDLPGYTNDGKTIVAVAREESGKRAKVFWTYDLQAKIATPHTCPDGYEIRAACMLGDQFWVELEGRENQAKATCLRFDAATNRLVAGPADLEGTSWLDPYYSQGESERAVLGSWQGKKAVLRVVELQPPYHSVRYEARSFPDLAKLGTTPYRRVLAAGRFWWVGTEGHGDDDQGKFHLFNDEGQAVVHFQEKAFPSYARLSDDRKALLLAFGRQSFKVFDVETGKFLWDGFAREALTGNPLVSRAEVWALEGGVSLVRYTPGSKATTRPDADSSGQTIMKLAIRGEPEEYNISPDGSHFVLLVNGPPPRLLFIPIKEGVTEKDVRSVELKDVR